MQIDTGYEGKFDFQRRTEPPALGYMLASVPRTGSTWFSHLLWKTGCLGAPLEYLNYEPAGPYFFAKSADQQLLLWHSVLHRRTSFNGVFGVKCFPSQLQDLQEKNPQLLSEVMATVLPRTIKARVVLLRRKDPTAHAISYARALLSGVWRSEQESSGSADVQYSKLALERAAKMLEDQAEAWESMFGDLGVKPLRLWYEDALDHPDRAVNSVAEYLGVTLDTAAAVSIPKIRRQSQQGAADWLEQHAKTGQI